MPEATDDRALITQTLTQAAAGVEAGDVGRLMAMFDDGPETFSFDYTPPRAVTHDQLRANFIAAQQAIDGSLTCYYQEIHVELLSPDAAWSWAIMHVAYQPTGSATVDLTARVTDVWRKVNDRWLAVHEHTSFPVDVATGRADLQSRV